ncbi:MAG: PASTA domain-containing protein [Candidatus Marinimicrobia bacterium]|nr:PASTA domain-containing protein [Candidatus Neomarinimicrobiota bacterium]MCF7829849.1 PASTA domain-containing protein [Candidatus Neomarinimicrobiota bacterium]MCF7882477.1 PASTA domain-containing protein [Candidatus Neomarinimicrobiota bacterium]
MKKKLIPVLHYLGSFLLIGLVLAVLVDQVIMPLYVKHGQKVNLPDVRGMKYEEASELLTSMEFTPVKGDMKYNAEFEPGQVIDQQPDPRATVKTGRRVYLTVAIAEKFIEMPTLVGKTVRGAKLDLSRVGLQVDTILQEYSDTFPEDVISWQSVKPKGLIRRGSEVTLRVSRGRNPNVFEVPDLVDMSLEEAKNRLSEEGLELGRLEYVQKPDLVPYTVLEQSREPGQTLTEPRPVDLKVSVLNLNDIFNEQMRQQ